jgi:hypothetical protein
MSDVAVATSATLANGNRAASMNRGTEAVLLAATGGLALAIGLLVYLTDRGVSHAVLIPTIGALAGSNLFGALGQWLPGFVHPFAFSLFTAAALPSWSAWRYGACAAWCAVNVAFELGQHPSVSARLADALHDIFGPTSLTQTLASYFLHGTFDVGDIGAAVLGAFAAAGLLFLLRRISENVDAL